MWQLGWEGNLGDNEYTYKYGWVFCCPPKMIKTLLISYTPVLSPSVMSNSLWPMDCSPPGSFVHGDSPGKNTGVVCHALSQGIFPTQGSSPGLPHYRWILYHLRHQEAQEYQSWVAYHFSRGSSDPGIEPGSPSLQADSLPAELWIDNLIRAMGNIREEDSNENTKN